MEQVKFTEIFISCVGTNPYTEVNYVYEDKYSREKLKTPFVQELLLKLHPNLDKYIFIMTEEARQKNWLSKRESQKANFEKGLKDRYASVKSRIKEIIIPEDRLASEKDLLILFTKLIDEVKPKGKNRKLKIYLDITHSFRYMPMFLLSFVNFISTIKNNISVEAIYYGHFFWDRDENGNIKIFPEYQVWNISLLYKFQKWAYAFFVFDKYGVVDEVVSLINDNNFTEELYGEDYDMELIDLLESLFKPKKPNDKKSAVYSIITDVQTSRGNRIQAKAINMEVHTSELKRVIEKNMRTSIGYNRVMYFLLKMFYNKVKAFGKRKKFIAYTLFYAADWAYKHKMYQQAITLLFEAIISYAMEKIPYGEPENHKKREKVKEILYGVASSKVYNNYTNRSHKKKLSQQDLTIIKKIKNDKKYSDLRELATLMWEKIRIIRNDINHGGFETNNWRSITIIENTEKYIDEAFKILNIPRI